VIPELGGGRPLELRRLSPQTIRDLQRELEQH
jgi:hypothetical protein